MKYYYCDFCIGLVPKDDPETHVCGSEVLPLEFSVSVLASVVGATYFSDKIRSYQYIRRLKFWVSDYVSCLEIVSDSNGSFSTRKYGNSREED